MLIDWAKDIVGWRDGKTLCLSVVFSWHLEKAKKIASEYKGPVIMGGPAVSIIDKDPVCEKTPYDVLSMHNPLATFTSRGCVRKCSFCAVPKIEGDFREIPDFKPAPIVCDNNFLSSSRKHIEKVIDSLRCFRAVDFNQGLDARLFKPWHAQLFKSLKVVKLRFSFDHTKQEKAITRAIEIAHKAGFTARDAVGVYVLIGWNDSPEDALHRLEWVRSQGHRPNPMRFQPLGAKKKNDFIASGWTSEELKKMSRYYSRLRYLGHIPYKDFERDRKR